jgi:hypothetical protein
VGKGELDRLTIQFAVPTLAGLAELRQAAP